MTLIDHPDYEAFMRRIQALPEGFVVAWTGTVFREEDYQWATRSNIVAGEGAMKSGGRWNTPGRARAVYCSLKRSTAALEREEQCRIAGFLPGETMPTVTISATAKFERLLDLSDGTLRQHLKLGLSRSLAAPWRAMNRAGQEARTQAFGRACVREQIEALLVPSAVVPSELNLVAFPDAYHKSRPISIFREDVLPS